MSALNSIKQLNNFGDSVTYNSGEMPIGTENIRLIIVIFMCSVSKMWRTNIFNSVAFHTVVFKCEHVL